MNILAVLCNYPAFARLELLDYCAMQITAPEQIEEILRVVKEDTDPIVRHEAVAQLVRLKREKGNLFTKRVDERIRAMFLAALDDNSVVVRHEILEALAYFGDATILETLRHHADDAEPDIRHTARLALELLQFRLNRGIEVCDLISSLFTLKH